MQIKTKQITHLLCPNCDGELSAIDEFLAECKLHVPRSLGPWGCDVCGKYHRFTVVKKESSFEITGTEDSKTARRRLVLLRYHDANVPLFIIIKDLEYSRNANGYDSPEEQADSDRYYYNEHTCPTNWMGVETIIYNGDPDYHGVFEFVRSVLIEESAEKLGITVKELLGCNNEDYLEELFPEIKKNEPKS